MVTDSKKLDEIVRFLADVRNVLDGGWHYSSPLIRLRRSDEGNPSVLVEESDCLSMVAQVVSDVDRVSDTLDALSTRATELGVNTVQLCGADLPLLARTYKALAIAIGNAANDALDALTATAAASKPARKGRQGRQKSDDNQTSLLRSEQDTTQPMTEIGNG